MEACERGNAEAIIEIDFQKMTVTNFSGGRANLSMKQHNSFVGQSYFASENGQMWSIGDKPLAGIAQEGAYAVRGATLLDQGGTLYWGECRPR